MNNKLNTKRNFAQEAKIFKAFCDENRLKILNLLLEGERCACEILEELDVAQSTLSHHMKILVDSGIVKARKDGKWSYYTIDELGASKAEMLLSTIISQKSLPKDQSLKSSKGCRCD